jgi:electron transfer flavoprotein alpha subunit
VIAKNCIECGGCIGVCPVGAISLPQLPVGVNGKSDSLTAAAAKSPAALVESDKLSRFRGVWVFIEQREGQILPVSMELLGAGGKLAQKLDVELSGVLMGDQVCGLVDKVYEYGADRVFYIDHPSLHYYRTEPYMRVMVDLAEKYCPEVILIGATTVGRDLAGAVATELKTGLTADCTELDIDSGQRLLLATRPAFGGNIMATIVARRHRPQMATIRPKVMRMAAPVPNRKGVLVQPEIELDENKILTRVLEVIKEQGEKVNLQDAEIIVAGGRGLGDRTGFIEICFGLARAIDAQVGASRAAVEAGWVEQKYQIGQTGVTVAPKIYLALGISGAVQHLVGIKGSDIIIAVNIDPDAPIFQECTYGIVGDVFKIVPLLTEPLKELLAENKASLARQLMSQEGSSCAGKI